MYPDAMGSPNRARRPSRERRPRAKDKVAIRWVVDSIEKLINEELKNSTGSSPRNQDPDLLVAALKRLYTGTLGRKYTLYCHR